MKATAGKHEATCYNDHIAGVFAYCDNTGMDVIYRSQKGRCTQKEEDMKEITLQEVLAAREARWHLQQRLLNQFHKPLLCFTMNIAGPVKRSREGDLAFRWALSALRLRLGGNLMYQELTDAPTGMEAALVCDLPPQTLKDLAVELETATPVGRLFDMDVIGPDGEKLSRGLPRTCLVCGGPVGPCARSRAHGLPAIQAATTKLLRDFAAEYLAELGVQALLQEVELTPKPGLVDRRNSGAHRDMDLPMFRRSAHSLRPYFQQAVQLGMERSDCMELLQKAGLAAERTMLETTGGVNTHKGAVYAFGIFLAALGSCLVRGGDVFDCSASLAQAGLPPENTHGTAAKARYGVSGARGEAMAGFPQARLGQRLLREHEGELIPVLLMLLARVEDTNLLHRGGQEGLAFVQQSARDILDGPKDEYLQRLEELDEQCIGKNLSPGGSADLLALSLLMDSTRDIWQES